MSACLLSRCLQLSFVQTKCGRAETGKGWEGGIQGGGGREVAVVVIAGLPGLQPHGYPALLWEELTYMTMNGPNIAA